MIEKKKKKSLKRCLWVRFITVINIIDQESACLEHLCLSSRRCISLFFITLQDRKFISLYRVLRKQRICDNLYFQYVNSCFSFHVLKGLKYSYFWRAWTKYYNNTWQVSYCKFIEKHLVFIGSLKIIIIL